MRLACNLRFVVVLSMLPGGSCSGSYWLPCTVRGGVSRKRSVAKPLFSTCSRDYDDDDTLKLFDTYPGGGLTRDKVLTVTLSTLVCGSIYDLRFHLADCGFLLEEVFCFCFSIMGF